MLFALSNWISKLFWQPMSRNALKLMHACINKDHEVSLHPFPLLQNCLWQESQTLKCVLLSLLLKNTQPPLLELILKKDCNRKKTLTQQFLKTLGLHLINVFQDINEQQFDFTNPKWSWITHNLIYEVCQGPACRNNKKKYPTEFYNL